MHIRNFRTQSGMHLIRTANKSYWQHFVFFRLFFVTFMPAPRVFRRAPVFVLLILNFFRQSKVTFLRLDKFENNF